MMDNERTRQLIRAWMMQRQAHPEPPPSPEQIRRKVGWAPDEPGAARPVDPEGALIPTPG